MIIYVVTRNSDLDEGRGHQIPVGYFSDKKIAEYVASKAPGVCGSRVGVEITPIEVDTTRNLEEYAKSESNKLKKSAMAKLTHEKLVALGLGQ